MANDTTAPNNSDILNQYWTSITNTLTGTLREISSSYSQADFNNAVKQQEIANTLASQFDYFSQRASDLAKSASQAGMDMRNSAQNALDSTSLDGLK